MPINCQRGFRGHPREAPQVTVQAGAIKGFAFEPERGIEKFFFALPVGHVHTDPFRDRAEAHAVLDITP
ncbi:hypothetical protein D3C84_1289100 [compost metagenome]